MRFHTLLYSDKEQENKKIAFFCRQYDMEVLFARTPEDVEKITGSVFIELAIVDLELTPCKLPAGTRTIAIGSSSPDELQNHIFYQPKAILVRPFADHIIKHLLEKTSGLTPESQTYPAIFIRLQTMLEEDRVLIRALLQRSVSQLDLPATVANFCPEHCPYAIKSNDIPKNDFQSYQVLSIGSGKGSLCCRFKAGCMLHKYAAASRTDLPEEMRVAPIVSLNSVKLNAENMSFMDALRETIASLETWQRALLDLRKKICKAECETIDPSALKQGQTIKKLCCERGCVLDAFFDLNDQPQKHLKTAKVLIYDDDPVDVKIIKFVCEQFGWNTLACKDPVQADAIFAAENIDFIIIDPDLDKLTIPRKVKVLIASRVTVATAASLISYRPISVIPKPFDPNTLSMAFAAAADLYIERPTLPSAVNNLLLSIKRTLSGLSVFMLEDHHKLSFPESVKEFCENRCQFATKKKDIPDSDLKDFSMLNPISRRGALYCRHRKTCKLWEFEAWLTNAVPGLFVDSPTKLLRDRKADDRNFSPEKGLTALIADLQQIVEVYSSHRLRFCTTICPSCKHDLNFTKTDNIHLAFEDIIVTNSCSYCSEDLCPLIMFFEYFRKKAV